MSSMDFNKIAGAAVLSALVLVIISVIGNALVHPRDAQTVAVAAVAPQEAPKAAAPEPEVPIGTLLASADPTKGAKSFSKCKACHTTENGGANKVGPNLWNVVNANRGAKDGFSYSDAIKGKEGAWTYESLSAFLARPKAYIPGTKMSFAGIKKAEERADLIAFLRSLSDSPAPLP